MTLTEVEAQMLLKIGEKYEKQDGSFIRGAFPKIKEEAALVVNLSAQQIKTFFKSRRERANKIKKRRLFPPDAQPQRVPIRMFYGYGSVRQPHSARETQRKDLEEEVARLRVKEDEIEKQQRELEEALEKVNQEREALKMEMESAHMHIAELNSAFQEKNAEMERIGGIWRSLRILSL